MRNKPISDERLASWKILLPHRQDYSVLVVGGEKGIPDSLSRSYTLVDWLCLEKKYNLSQKNDDIFGQTSQKNNLFFDWQACNKKYDILVVATSFFMTYKTKFLYNLLHQNGILVFLQLGFGMAGRHKLCGSRFKYLIFYSALPFRNPRFFFPTTDKNFRQKSLSFHTPGSRTGLYLIKILRWLSKSGLTVPFYMSGVTILSKRVLINGNSTLFFWLREELGLEIKNLTIYCGSDLPKRKMTLLAEAEYQGQVKDFIIKIGDTLESKKAIENEMHALNSLCSPYFERKVPAMIFSGQWNGYAVQVQTKLPLKKKWQCRHLKQKHIEFLEQLSETNRRTIRLKETQAWKTIKDKLRNSDSENWPICIHHLVTLMIEKNMLEVKCPVHSVHGDFTPWNIHCSNGQLYVFDWEDSQSDGIAFSDLFYFIYRQASLMGPWPGGRTILKEFQSEAQRLGEPELLSGNPFAAILSLWMIDEFIRRPHAHILELVQYYFERLNG